MAPIPTSFRAAVNKTTHDVVVEERPIRPLSGTQVLVKMEATGICASDLHLTRKLNPYLIPSVDIGGHEGVGRIAALGPDADRSQWKEGDRVAVRWLYYVCQKCELCRGGLEALCDQRVLGSVNVEGCWGGESVIIVSCLFSCSLSGFTQNTPLPTAPIFCVSLKESTR